MRKYGMRFSTIRYWQNEGISLVRMVGRNWTVQARYRYTNSYRVMSSREIAYFAIKMAAIDEAIESL